MLELALVENIQREDINAIERARAYQRLKDEFGLDQDAVSAAVGKSRTSVANTVRLLTLPSEVQEAIAEGKLTEGHGRALIALGRRKGYFAGGKTDRQRRASPSGQRRIW